jgi:hypothetical protein
MTQVEMRSWSSAGSFESSTLAVVAGSTASVLAGEDTTGVPSQTSQRSLLKLPWDLVPREVVCLPW